jgi:hypothetical protein
MIRMISRIFLAGLVLASICLMGQAGVPVLAGDVTVKKDQASAQPTWPAACRLAMKNCRVIRTCRDEKVLDCSEPGKCKLLLQVKRTCHCRVMCRWPGQSNCTIHAQCPPGN